MIPLQYFFLIVALSFALGAGVGRVIKNSQPNGGLVKHLLTIPPVVIDGTLYVMIGILASFDLVMGSPEAYKYVNPYLLFWMNSCAAILLGAANNLKAFRDKGYTDHLAARGIPSHPSDTTFITKTPNPPNP